MSNTPDSNPLDRPHSDSLRIEVIVDEQVSQPIDQPLLHRAAAAAASHRGFFEGEIGIRVTDDAAIHLINRDHLGHDYPTDVISFAYQALPPSIEGELVASAETAARHAARLGWPAEHELVLYIVHGTLHIAGMDDANDQDRVQMRQAERAVMIDLGIEEIVQFGADRVAAAEGQA